MSEAAPAEKRSFADWVTIYSHPKVLVVLLLGFSSGMPYFLIGATLSAWLKDAGLDLSTIGLFALISLPYSINFLAAPFADHLKLPYLTKRFGRRRGWLLPIQIGLMLSIAALARFEPSVDTMLFVLVACAIGFFAALQDVVIDAFRAEYLGQNQYGEGAAVAVFGYRVALLVTGAGALALADQLPWPIVYQIMACCMVVGIITTLCVSEPENHSPKLVLAGEGMARLGSWLHQAVIEPFRDFMIRHPQWWLILLLIMCYRIPDGFIGFILNPYYMEIGFEKSQIAAIAKVYGFGATLAGMFIGGALVHRLGIMRSLWWFLLFQIVTNLTYAGLTVTGPNPYYLMFAISMDNLAGGMIATAAIAYMMSLCNLQFTATQYALLTSLVGLSSKTLAAFAGMVAESFGWVALFGLSALLGIPAILLLLKLKKQIG